MTVEKGTRWLAWEGCRNARDLGGYRTMDGRMTRWGAITRSDTPSALTATGQAALVAYGIRAIIDLRRPDELNRSPNPFAAPNGHGIAYANLSLSDPEEAVTSVHYTSLTDDHTLVNDYREKLERSASRIAAIMSAIARATEGGVLIHCAAGKDRTGLVCALLLGLVGVDRETIAADYALSARVRWPEDAEWLANGPGERADRERALERWSARAEVMGEIVEQWEEQYGSAEEYLLRAGVTEGDIWYLRTRLIPHL